MKLLTLAFLSFSSSIQAAIVIIDDFSFVQGPLASAGSYTWKQETSDASIYGGYRSILATGFLPFVFVDWHMEPGDLSGFSSIDVSGGTMNLSKTAYTGSAFATYEGRAFTSGDQIGNLSMNISGGPLSLTSPILYLAHLAPSSDQLICLSLSSAIDTYSSFDILLKSGSTETMVDLRTVTPVGTGVLGGVNFSNVEDLLLGFKSGSPSGSIQMETFAFIPESSTVSLLAMCMATVLLRRNRNAVQESAGQPATLPAKNPR